MRPKGNVDPDLKGSVIAILLAGWLAEPPADVDAGPHGFGNGYMTLLDPDGPQRLWEAHERFLRATAARWNWQPTTECADGKLRYWSEAQSDGFGDGFRR